MVNVFMRVYFDIFIEVCLFFCVGGFIGIIGGTPDKRISEGIFYLCGGFIGIIGGPLINVFLRVYYDVFFGLFFRHYRGDP